MTNETDEKPEYYSFLLSPADSQGVQYPIAVQKEYKTIVEFSKAAEETSEYVFYRYFQGVWEKWLKGAGHSTYPTPLERQKQLSAAVEEFKNRLECIRQVLDYKFYPSSSGSLSTTYTLNLHDLVSNRKWTTLRALTADDNLNQVLRERLVQERMEAEKRYLIDALEKAMGIEDTEKKEAKID